MFRSQGGAEGAGRGVRPGAAAARPVPDREVAGAPRRRRSRVPPTSRLGASASTARSTSRSTLTWAELNELPHGDVTQDIHCVTRWSRFDAEFDGRPLVGELAELVRPRPSARFAIAHAEAGFTANVPLVVPRATRARCSPRTPTASRSRRSTAGRCASSSRASTSGRAPSGCAGSSCARPTSRASGSATATQRRRSLEGGAVRLLRRITRSRESAAALTRRPT